MVRTQIEPDWAVQGFPAELEQHIGGKFKFKGPGIYLTKTDTIFIIPLNRGPAEFWHKKYGEKEWFKALVFNTSWDQTIYARFDFIVPVREDSR